MKPFNYRRSLKSATMFGAVLIAATFTTSCFAQSATAVGKSENETNLAVDSKNELSAVLARASESEQVTASCWPSFLGRGATQLTPSLLPTHWSHQKNVSWKTSILGAGQSSPVIWGDQVFVTSIEGDMKDECLVTCISLADGETLWTYKTPSSQPVRSNYYQSRSAPTPVVDQDRIYCLFETGKLVALDHQGEEIWVRSLTDDYGAFEVRIGLAASLAQTEDHVIGLVDHEGPSYLLAVDKSTGKTAWKTERFSRQSYTSPIILPIAGEPQVVCSSDGSVDGYDIKTGEQLWTYEEVGGNRATSPLPISDGVFLISASPGMHGEYSEDAKASNMVMRVERNGEDYQPSVVWRTEKAMPSFASPMVHQGHAYWVSNTGILFCFDAKTGEMSYKHRLGQRCWATPLGVGDHVYFFGKDGTTKVLAAGGEYQVIAENELIQGATEAGHADIKKREEREKKNQMADKGTSAEKEKSDSNAASQGQDRGRDRGRSSRDGVSFAESIQYGYAAVDGSLVIRTGSNVFCIRNVDAGADSPQESIKQKSASTTGGDK